MTELQGHAHKMRVEHDQPVSYTLPLDDHRLALNPQIGSTLSIEFTGAIHCINCGRKTRKSYSQGYCFPCSQRLARCDMCIVRPHTCHFDAGTCREPDWALSHCFQDHYVYLANSSGLKVGITRQDQLPTRWIDQGATQALPLFRTRSRLIAGLLEKAIGAHVSDRTDWRRMLKGNAEPQALQTEGERLVGLAAAEIEAILAQKTVPGEDVDAFERLTEQHVVEINYPVEVWPDKVRAHNLDKNPLVKSELQGIKGQYLIFADGVLNVRKYTGYELVVRTE
ncbi:MAG: DUF2797 domain-containing protein [Pseudomonadota bacterium]